MLPILGSRPHYYFPQSASIFRYRNRLQSLAVQIHLSISVFKLSFKFKISMQKWHVKSNHLRTNLVVWSNIIRSAGKVYRLMMTPPDPEGKRGVWSRVIRLPYIWLGYGFNVEVCTEPRI